MKIILVDPNLVRNIFGNNFLILIMVRTLENDFFLVRTKLGHLRYSKYPCHRGCLLIINNSVSVDQINRIHKGSIYIKTIANIEDKC